MGVERVQILVVDDSERDRELMKQWLTSAGYCASCASGGIEALCMLKERAPAVLLTDLHMPGMDGLTLARKARDTRPETSVILCTADWSPQLLELARQTGIAAVFGKPLNLLRIAKAIANEVERQNTRKRLEKFLPEWGSWTCPLCSTRHLGWSPINVCSGCGYRDDSENYGAQLPR